MPPDVIGGLVAVAGMMGVGTMILIGLKMRFNHKLRMRQDTRPLEVERLTDLVEAFHDEMRATREEVSELHERMDFAERMLSNGTPRAALDERASTPV